MIQRSRIHCEQVGYTRFCTRSQATGAVRSRNREAARVAKGHTVRSQHTVGKRCRSSTTCRQCSGGADIYRVPGSSKERLGVVARILSRDLDVKARSSHLGPNGSSANRLNHKVIQSCGINRKGVRYSDFNATTQTTSTIRCRNRETTRVADGHAMGSQYTVGKCNRCTTTGRQCSRGADFYRVSSTGKERLGVVVYILGRDLDVKGNRRCLGSDGSTTLCFHHEVIQCSWINREGIGNTSFSTRSQTTGAVRGRDREAARITDRHAVGGQHTVGERGRCTVARRQGARGADLRRVPRSVKEGLSIIVRILGRDPDIKRGPGHLSSNGTAANRLNHEVIQRSRIHCERVGNSRLRIRPQPAYTIRSRYREATCIGNCHAVGSQHAAGKGCRCTVTRRKCTRRADLHGVTGTIKQGYRVIISILGRDTDVKRSGSRLCPDGSTTLSFDHEVIERCGIYRK